MRTNLKTIKTTITGAAIAVFIFSGCGDSEQYHVLTGSKSAEEVKIAYVNSWYLEDEESKKIYAKWLDRWDDSQDQFSFNSFRISTRSDYEKTLKNLQSAKLSFDENTSIYKINKEIRRSVFFAANIKYVKEVYIPHLKELKKKIENKKRKHIDLSQKGLYHD
ncbi:MAG: hypothetical protein WA945_10240 [Arcobacteraceae bacterium]